MNPLPATPFESGWWSFDLGDYRPCDATYCRFPLGSLPPIPEPDPTLNWLVPLTRAMERYKDIHDPAYTRSRLDVVMNAAEQLGLVLPEAFVRLMGSAELLARIPFGTGCWFHLGGRIFPCPGSPGAYLVRFLRDQQDCIIWYLYLTLAGEHCVVTISGDVDPFLDDEDDVTPDPDADMQAVARDIAVCAPSFAAFIYRFWLENSIAFKLPSYGRSPLDRTPLTDDERRYLEHYEQQNTSGR